MKTSFILILLVYSLNSVAQSGSMIDPRDGKEYKTVQIGKQVWMAENLAYKMEIINKVKPTSFEFAVCYTDSSTFPNEYGFLYNWNAAQNACPTGWHLPTKAEFDTLLSSIGGNRKQAYIALIKNGSSGFNGLLRGYLRPIGSYIEFRGLNKGNGFWFAPQSKNKISNRISRAEGMSLNSTLQKVIIGNRDTRKGYSVRCVKN